MARTIGLLGATFAFGLLSVWLAWRPPGLTFAAVSQANMVLQVAAGWGLVTVGMIARNKAPNSPVGSLLAWAGVSSFIVSWTNPGTGTPLVFTAGLVLSASTEPLVAHAILAFPSGRLHGSVERWTVRAAYATNLLLLGLVPALVSNPSTTGCSICPENLLGLRSEPDLAAAIGRAGLLLAVIWVWVCIALLVRRMIRATRPARVATMAVIIPGSVYLALFAIDAVHDLPAGVAGLDELDTLLWQGQAIALIALALGVASEWVRARRTRTRVAGVVVDLAESRPPGGLRTRLSALLDDPDLVLAYRISIDRFVDSEGHLVTMDVGPGRLVTPLVRDGEEVAVLGHRLGLEDDPAQMEAVIRAARLSLENERLQAVARARLADLHVSRARVVEAGDAERRRLERDLHDGAQQRLVSLSFALRILRRRLEPVPASPTGTRATAAPATIALDQAEAELGEAISDLRELAHGIYPAILELEGLAAGVEALAERSRMKITINAMPQERFDAPIEAAAYSVIAEVARTPAQRCRIVVRHVGESLLVDVEYDGEPMVNLSGLEDRIGALDGSVSVATSKDGLRSIHAEIPCGS